MTKKLPSPIGILGGTFDPIHQGHLQLAQIVLEKLNFAEIRFIPNFKPPHRPTPMVSHQKRLAMLKLALEDHPRFVIDTREIERKGISYTIDTLKSLRTDFPDTPLCWIIGFDEFAKLNTWHAWQSLIHFVHFIIIKRPVIDKKLPPEIEQLLYMHETEDKAELEKTIHGKIYQLNTPFFDIAATEIRNQFAKKEEPIKGLPEKVYEYIQQKGLYI